METQEQNLDHVSTQELAEELFSRSDWREAEIPGGTGIERGKAMKMNAQDEVGEDNYVWPVVRMGKMELGNVLQNAAEGYWRTHVNSFRQHDTPQIAHKHRHENTTGEKWVNSKEMEVPIVEVSAMNAGEVVSREQELIEAKKKIQQLVESGTISKEEAQEIVDGA